MVFTGPPHVSEELRTNSVEQVQIMDVIWSRFAVTDLWSVCQND